MSNDISRRAFFRNAISDGQPGASASHLNSHAAAAWFRPPFAVDEFELLINCTRCGACMDACEHNVIFALDAEYGSQLKGTPALDLTNNSCNLCVDWPCVDSCVNGVLTKLNHPPMNADGDRYLPRLAQVIVDSERCLAWSRREKNPGTDIMCANCLKACPVPDALLMVDEKPVINHDKCAGCAKCRQACVTQPPAIEVSVIQ